MSNDYPFYLYRRNASPFWSVRYKLESGCYTGGKSTKQTDKKEAEKVAIKWLVTGEYKESAKQSKIKKFKADIRKLDIDDEDLLYVLEELKRRNVISKVIIKQSPEAIKAVDFLRKFWNWETSPYVAEKHRQGHSLHLTHVINMNRFVEKYWVPFLGDKELGEISRADIEQMIVKLSALSIAPHSKNQILRSFTTCIKWAANHELIEKDVSQGIMYFSGAYKEREILTPELAHAIFTVEWKDEKARLANLVAMLTGMRSGEIRALQLKDLGHECLYIRHSWNDNEGLKCTKNGEERIVQFPFPELIDELKDLYFSNPKAKGLEEYIFWSTKENQPIDADIFIDGLRKALVSAGLTESTAKKYTFHAWRHFFTTYMATKVDTKLLQMQTGHKTKVMLEHYASHKTEVDYSEIRQAQKDFFSQLLFLENG